MKHRRPPIPVIVILVLAIAVGGYYGIRSLLPQAETGLTASGTIEAAEITISPEVSGKVLEVRVGEGDAVKAGDVLFRLDGTLLEAQRAVASTALDMARAAAETAKRAQETAEANFTLAFDAARAEATAARTADWRAANPPGYDLSGGYFSLNELKMAAVAEVDAARSARDTAQTRFNDLWVDPANADFIAAETRLINARAGMLVAQDVLARAKLSGNDDLIDSAQAAYDTAETELENAQSGYDELKDTEVAKSIITARSDLAAAQEAYEVAQDRLLALEIGIDSPKVVAAQAALNQAVEAAQQAQIAVTQAEASLALIDVQIGKLTVSAPSDGTVMTLTIQPGEVIAAASAALTLAKLDDLTITVYIPEDRYGELSLGQTASVIVDSFPGMTFKATIIYISDKAEFTPRNVQTVEGRKATVFAIKLRLEDPEGKLKPGMPADLEFTQ